MRNRIAATRPLNVWTADHQRSSEHVVLEAVRHVFTAIVDWLRAGYPDEAPRTGYSPLVALAGPRSLTPKQTEQVFKDLEHRPSNTTAIDVAITKATNRLPTPAQTRTVATALRHRTSHP